MGVQGVLSLESSRSGDMGPDGESGPEDSGEGVHQTSDKHPQDLELHHQPGGARKASQAQHSYKHYVGEDFGGRARHEPSNGWSC